MNRVLVKTPSRLHFGLLGWGPASARQFGGFGLMTEDPGLEVEVEPAPDWSFEGAFAVRASVMALTIAGRLQARGVLLKPSRVVVRNAPAAHIGLGVGTQLGLALARALALLGGVEDATPEFLAGLSGRGLRSGVGLHGFFRGGFLVDGGRGVDSTIPPLLVRHGFPEEWSVLILVPRVQPGLHGQAEVQAFQRLPSVDEGTTSRLCRLLLLGVLPALVEADLASFGSALQEVQREVGRLFSTIQGGVYAHPEIARLAERMTDAGLQGVGQSSWGPTLYGFTDAGHDDRRELLRSLTATIPEKVTWASWTKANTSGARLTIDE